METSLTKSAFLPHKEVFKEFYKSFPSLKGLSLPLSSPIFLLCAGEPSGDLLGSSLIQALKKVYPSATFLGIGGPLMEKEGLLSLFSADELAIIGITEIVPKIWPILKRIRHMAKFITQLSPDAMITIDAPAFSFRLGQALRKLEKKASLIPIPHIHVVAPTVWAWRPKRAYKISRFLTHLLTLFPFEPPYFEKYGLPTTFIGHPLVELEYNAIDKTIFRKKRNIEESIPLIALLPGSRTSELNKHLPIFIQALTLLYKKGISFICVLPTFPKFEKKIKSFLSSHPHPFSIYTITKEGDKKEALKASTIALAASGTVTLELACANVPSIIAYKANPLTAFIVKRMISIPYVGLPNILLDKPVVPELLQENCTPTLLADALEKLITSQDMQNAQKENFEKIKVLLKPKDTKLSPSETAAQVIKKILNLHKI